MLALEPFAAMVCFADVDAVSQKIGKRTVGSCRIAHSVISKPPQLNRTTGANDPSVSVLAARAMRS
jgi:hypothetical protein